MTRQILKWLLKTGESTALPEKFQKNAVSASQP
jgi:hypothetical protein